MTLRIVRLGTPRLPNEGLRIGAVRRPPRGVPKAEFASRDFYDLWLPVLSPSAELVKQALDAREPREWAAFVRRFRAELSRSSEAKQLLDLLAALSRQTNFSIGCYCEDESRCHRSVLRALLADRDAELS